MIPKPAWVVACLLLGCARVAAQPLLWVGDQKGGSKALMEAAGALEDLPYRVEWREFAAAAPLLEALSAGAIETGIVGDAPFTFAAAAGLPAKAIAAIRSDQAGLAILVRHDSPIQAVEDLKGKRIATGKGSIGHQLLLAVIERQGWSQDAVTAVFLQPPDAKVAYASGSADAWSTWEPYVAQEEILFGARRIITGKDLTPGLSFQIARDDIIGTKHALLEDFIARLAKARAWSFDHIDRYAETWANLFGVTREVPRLWLSRAQIRLAVIDATVVSDEQRTIDLYARNGLIARKLQAADILDRSFNSAIMAGSVAALRN